MTDAFLILWQEHAWGRLGVTVIAGLLLGLTLRVAVYAVLRRVVSDRPVITDLMQRARAPLEWLLPLLVVTLALRSWPPGPSASMALIQHLLLIGLLAVATWLVVRCIGAFEDAAVRRYPMDAADNLRARRVVTQVRVLARTGDVIVIIFGISIILLTIPGVRQLGASLLASAGVAGLAIGLAARPVLSNLIAGLQIALTQPIRLDDVVIIEGEWGRIEEIAGSYVVVRIWDERRLVVPLNWFIEHPFQNWTRSSSELIGTVFLMLDFRTPLAPLREELQRLCEASPQWDRRVCVMQVTDANEQAMQIRMLVSSTDSGRNFDLRCQVREGLICFVQTHYPEVLPRWRGELDRHHPESDPVGVPDDPDPQRSPSPEDGGPRRQVR